MTASTTTLLFFKEVSNGVHLIPFVASSRGVFDLKRKPFSVLESLPESLNNDDVAPHTPNGRDRSIR